MPTLGAPLDFAKLEGRNFRGHLLGAAPSSPVTGQLYYNTGDNTLYWWDGTQWVSARGGAAATPPATTGALGTVQLAGDLAGTATSPQIAAGVITDADVNAANKDGAVGTASMRTLGAGAQQAMPGNRTLDVITPPAAAVQMNNQLIRSVSDPASAQDAATKNYVDGIAAGLSWKAPVRVIATTSLSGGSAPAGAQTIDGVAVANGDRVLCVAQTNAQYNGIYSVQTSGTWGRALSADTQAELLNAAVFVSEGTTYADTAWVCTANAPIVVDTTPLPWVQFAGAGEYIGGAGLVLTGKQFDVVGATNRIQVNIDNIDISSAYAGQGTITTVGTITTGTWNGTSIPIANGGTGSSTAKAARETGLGAAGYYNNGAVHSAGTTITILQSTHGLRATRGLIVQVQDSGGNVLLPDVTVQLSGDITITFAVSQAANSIIVTVVG